MATAILNTVSHAPTAHLQIKYTTKPRCLLPDTRTSSPFFSSLRMRAPTLESAITNATVIDNNASSFYRIAATVRNTSSTAQTQAIKVYSWPMFEPENSQFVASGSTSMTVLPTGSGLIEVDVPKRELATYNEKTNKWVLEEGIYMFEIRSANDLNAGAGLVKQVSVVGRLQWDE